jgi:hypothetical protein
MLFGSCHGRSFLFVDGCSCCCTLGIAEIGVSKGKRKTRKIVAFFGSTGKKNNAKKATICALFCACRARGAEPLREGGASAPDEACVGCWQPKNGRNHTSQDHPYACLLRLEGLSSAPIRRRVGSREKKMFDRELEAFKIEIDLQAYAASHGYAIDTRESSRGCTVMRHPTGDKIMIKRDADNHFVYFSVRDERDHGTIIDFVCRRLNVSLGTARKELRPWLSIPPAAVPSYPSLPCVAKDRLRVLREFARMQDAPRHPYLEGERCIPAAVLASERFLGKIKIDARGNAVFPHFDAEGLSGYELKNRNFTGFASGGTKALWISNTHINDRQMVFGESAIDLLSHIVLFPSEITRYASVGGKTNQSQPELVRATVARMPGGSEIVAAMDADTEGRKLAELVRQAVDLSGRTDLRFQIHEPSGFKDWNDQLRARPRYSLPYRPEELSA